MPRVITLEIARALCAKLEGNGLDKETPQAADDTRYRREYFCSWLTEPPPEEPLTPGYARQRPKRIGCGCDGEEHDQRCPTRRERRRR